MRRLHSLIREKSREIACIPIATGGVEDHVHVLCQFPATVCIADIVKRIKGASSHFMNDEMTGYAAFKWQGTYGAFTICETAIPNVKGYVLNQKAHHAANDLHVDWERVWIPDDVNGTESAKADLTMISGEFHSPVRPDSPVHIAGMCDR